jgi:molybdopterin molybdotransferase
MAESLRVGEFAHELLQLAQPIEPFEMPLLDAHGATLAHDVFAGDRLVLRAGSRIRSTQIGLAASIGLDRLPTRPQPRVVVISAGSDLVEPGSPLQGSDDEFETNSWLLTTAMKEAGAVAYRVHMIPENETSLKAIVEDQLVRADLVVISGESHDDSYPLITNVLKSIGEIREIDPRIEVSGLHNFGTIGPDKTPVVTLPGDPIAAYISCELFIRPMIRQMMGLHDLFRPVQRAILTNSVESEPGQTSFLRAQLEGNKVTVANNQAELVGLSDANCLVVIGEDVTSLNAGAEVDVMMLERRYI